MSRELLSSENDRSTDDLFTRVLDDLRQDDDAPLGALVALHGRPSREVVNRAAELCDSTNPYERTVGLRVLRELKHQLVDRDLLWKPIEPLVLRLTTNDEDPDVIQWAISCLGYQTSGPEAVAAVLGRVDHPDPRVRFAVAAALPDLLDIEHPDMDALAALTKLTDDPNADVRACALMGLIWNLGRIDESRTVLQAHLTDPDGYRSSWTPTVSQASLPPRCRSWSRR